MSIYGSNTNEFPNNVWGLQSASTTTNPSNITYISPDSDLFVTTTAGNNLYLNNNKSNPTSNPGDLHINTESTNANTYIDTGDLIIKQGNLVIENGSSTGSVLVNAQLLGETTIGQETPSETGTIIGVANATIITTRDGTPLYVNENKPTSGDLILNEGCPNSVVHMTEGKMQLDGNGSNTTALEVNTGDIVFNDQTGQYNMKFGTGIEINSISMTVPIGSTLNVDGTLRQSGGSYDIFKTTTTAAQIANLTVINPPGSTVCTINPQLVIGSNVKFPSGNVQDEAVTTKFSNSSTHSWTTVTVNRQGVVTSISDGVWPYIGEFIDEPVPLATVLVNSEGQIIDLEPGDIPLYSTGWFGVTNNGGGTSTDINHALHFDPVKPPRIRVELYGDGLLPTNPNISFNWTLYTDITSLVGTNVYTGLFADTTNLTGCYRILNLDHDTVRLFILQAIPGQNNPMYTPGTVWWRVTIWRG